MADYGQVVPEFTVPGTRKWMDTLISTGRRYADFAEKDVRPLVERYRQLVEHEVWLTWLKDEPKTVERFCLEALGYSVEFLDTMDRGVQVLDGEGHDGPITMQQAADAELGRNGGDRVSPSYQSNNVTLVQETRGNDQTYTRRRLRRDHPDLADRVSAGELSANAAARLAGWRPHTISVPVDRPERVAASLRRHMSPDDLARLIRLLDPLSPNFPQIR